MSLASTHHELDEIAPGRFRHVQHMKPIASYRNGSLRRDPGVLSATGAADWPLGVDGICDVRVDPRIAGKSPLLHMGHGKDFVRFALVGANNVSGVCKGNVTTFTNAWNGADLRYTYGGRRLQEDILLRAKHPRSFGFILREHTGFDPLTMTVGDIRILDPVLEPPSGDMALAVPLKWLVTQQGGYWVLTCVLPAGDWAGWVLDPTLTLQPGAADGMDAMMQDTVPTKNYGISIAFGVGYRFSTTTKYRSLIQFNVSTIPATATVTAAMLSTWLYSSGSTFASNNRTLQAYRVKRVWVEGTEDGGTGGTGITWNKYDTTNNWGTAGCSNTTSDREATGIGSHGFLTTDAANSQHDWTLTAGAGGVQDWITGAMTNNGLALIADTESNDMYFMHSSDGSTASYRPQLVVTYTLPGGGGIFGSSIFHSAIMGATLTR